MNEKEIKAEIRRLKKLKLQCRPGSVERLDLEHKIKDLKKKKTEFTTIEPGKENLITEILRIEAERKIKPRFEDLRIDLRKFTEIQLKIHLDKLNKGVGK